MAEELKLAIAQIKPAWLNRFQTLARIADAIEEAAAQGAELVAFGEALVPGYPFWVERTDGARFEDARQKALYAHYLAEAVCIEAGHLNAITALAARYRLAVVLGIIERPQDRGGHSLYCARVYIEPDGRIGSIHRKLVPTYEERLVWAPGDGHGLVVHRLGAFTVGALNCWENWMPLARAALYAQGEDLHIALWPGGLHNTPDITRHIARESRSYVLSVSGLMHADDISPALPHYDVLAAASSGWLANGGSCLAGPDGQWLVEPVIEKEFVKTVRIEHARVRAERLCLDVSGHYARPDVLSLNLNSERQGVLKRPD